MAESGKKASKLDANLTQRTAFNDELAAFTSDGFISAKVGHKIELAISTTNVANDTETFTYSDNGTTLVELEIIYTDGTRETMLSSERIS